MNTPRSTIWAERLIFLLALLTGVWFLCQSIYNYGFTHGQAARVCAAVPGERVVSTTAEVCTYASDYGRATKKRRAM